MPLVISPDSEISHEQLEEYMRTGGKTTVRHALGVVVGCGGAGKTTLLYRLMGKNDNEIEEIKSTRGLEIHEHIFVVKDEDMIGKMEIHIYNIICMKTKQLQGMLIQQISDLASSIINNK